MWAKFGFVLRTCHFLDVRKWCLIVDDWETLLLQRQRSKTRTRSCNAGFSTSLTHVSSICIVSLIKGKRFSLRLISKRP